MSAESTPNPCDFTEAGATTTVSFGGNGLASAPARQLRTAIASPPFPIMVTIDN
jgi:hypothetical protein